MMYARDKRKKIQLKFISADLIQVSLALNN